MFSYGKEEKAMKLRDTRKKSTIEVIRWPVRIFSILFLMLAVVTAIRGLRRSLDKVRQFNKRFLNPAVLTVAGRKHSPYAVIHHMGRHSGRMYATPVVVEETPDGFVIPLPYGNEVDWCRNILAAGRCTIEWKGKEYEVVAPELIDSSKALPMISPARRLVFRALKIKQCLRLLRSADVLEAMLAGV